MVGARRLLSGGERPSDADAPFRSEHATVGVTSSMSLNRPTVFLSSVYGQLACFRRDVAERAKADGIHVWVAEIDAPDLPLLQPDLPEDEYRRRSALITDRCLRAVRDSHGVIFVAGGYGSARFPRREDEVTILELELFQAVLHVRPLYFYQITRGPIDERLGGLLSILTAIYPGLVTIEACRTEQDALEKIAATLRHSFPQGQGPPESIQQFANRLRELIDEEMDGLTENGPRFLDGRFVGIAPRSVRRDLVEALVHDADRCHDEATRLAYLWVAVRYLAAVPYDRPENVEWLALWESVLKRWASAAAWYGLHGLLKFGRLAAVKSLQKVQERLSASGARSTQTIQASLGAVASEYYSSAKLASTPQRREALLNAALRNVRQQIKMGGADQSGLLLIQGPIELQLGKRLSAILTCWRASRLRKSAGEDEGRIGEAETHLGLACLIPLGWPLTAWWAKRLLTCGVRRLEEHRRDGFLVTAKKKLGYCHLALLDVRNARRELEEAMQLARDRCFFDQMLQLDAMLRKLPQKLGSLRMAVWLLRHLRSLKSTA